MEDDNNYGINLNNNHLSIIDESPELTTLIAATKMENCNQSVLSNKILSKLSRGYTIYTVIKVISYSINETSFILPYCLRKLGIIPFILFLIILPLSSVYFFYLIIDIVLKLSLFDNYHEIIQEKTNKYYNIFYYLLNIIYHVLIITFEIYLYLSLCLRIISFFGFNINNIFYEKILILYLSLILIELPFSFINHFQKPDLLYIIITFFIVILNFIALFFILINHKTDFINLIKVNAFESISKDYFTAFSIIMTVIGWQNQISKQLNNFKIKTPKRFYKVVYLFFIIELILILFICFVSTPLISDRGDLIIFFLDYKNSNIDNILIIQVLSIIFGIIIHIIIGHHMQLIKENVVLIIKLSLYKKAEDDFKLPILFSLFFNLCILFLSNTICLFTEDITLIILLYGGILTPLLNYLIPTFLYCFKVSINSIIVWVACLITFIIISLGLVGFIFKIFI